MDILQWHHQALADAATPGTLHAESPPVSGSGRRWLAQLRRHLNAVRVTTDPAERLCEQLSEIVEDNQATPPGAKTVISLTAPFGAGKSTLVKHWAYGLHRDRIADLDHDRVPTWRPRPGTTATLAPVLYAPVRANSKIKDLNAEILAFLGYPGEGLTRATTTHVVAALATHGVQLIILDDVHMLHTRNRSGRDTLDYVKYLNTALGELGGTLVLVGADLTGGDLLVDEQIETRLAPFTLDPYPQPQDVAGRRAWQRFLKALEAHHLPYLPEAPTGLLAQTHAGYLWKRTQGYVGETVRLVTRAVLTARTDGDTTLTRELLDETPVTARATRRYASTALLP